ncbi:MAG: MlaD family protein [Deltaproteobacteria bacterium]|nr:MlaD family protein [Deltaproteobacteria bacterium]
MEYSRTEIGTGLMIVAAGLLAAVVIFVVGDFRNLFTPRIRLEIVFDESHGIKRYAEVRYAGVKIGQVDAIDLDQEHGQRVVLGVMVQRDAEVQEGAVPRIKTLGFLGERYVAIEPPEKQGRTLSDGERLEGRTTVPLEDIGAVLGDLTDQIGETRNQLDSLLNDKEFQENLKATVKNAREMTAELQGLLSENRAAIGETLASTRSATSELDELLTKHKDDLSTTLGNLASLSEKLDAMANDLEVLAEKSRGLMDRNDQEIDGTIADLRATARNARELSSDLKRHPNRLIKIFPDLFPWGGDDGDDKEDEDAAAGAAATP